MNVLDIPRGTVLGLAAAVVFAAALSGVCYFSRKTPVMRPAAPADRIIVSLPDRERMVVKAGQIAGVCPIAIGKPETPTPTGQFHLSHFESDPDLPGSPTGVRWMAFFRQKTAGGSTELTASTEATSPRKSAKPFPTGASA
jgi:hypothetical protein